jgi:hypothetical protein
MSPEKEKAIKKHFDKKIKEFKQKALKIALENNHPYIEAILKMAIYTLQDDIKAKAADIREDEYIFLNL